MKERARPTTDVMVSELPGIDVESFRPEIPKTDVLIEGVMQFRHRMLGKVLAYEPKDNNLLFEGLCEKARGTHTVITVERPCGERAVTDGRDDEGLYPDEAVVLQAQAIDGGLLGELLLNGKKALYEGDYDSAIRFFDDAERKGSMEARLWKGLAIVHRALKGKGGHFLNGLHEMAEAVICLQEGYLKVLYRALEECHQRHCFSVPFDKNTELDLSKIVDYIHKFLAESSITGKNYAASKLLWALRIYLKPESSEK